MLPIFSKSLNGAFNTRYLAVRRDNGQLLIRTRREGYLLALLQVILMCGWMPITYLLFHQFLVALWMSVIFLPVMLPILWSYREKFRRWVFVFDRSHDFVTLNGDVICGLTEVESVQVRREFAPFGYASTAGVRELCFVIHGRTRVVLVRKGHMFGPSMAELYKVGEVLAQYADVSLFKHD